MVIKDTDQIHDFIYKYLENAVSEEPLDDHEYVIAQDHTVQILTHCAIKRRIPGGVLPIHITHVDGDFFVAGQVTSLINMPHTVVGDFECSACGLTSLEHGPTQVGGSYDCSHNRLMSLTHAAPVFSGELNCEFNQLEDLTTAPACAYLHVFENPIHDVRGTPDHVHTLALSWHPQLPLLSLLHLEHVEILDKRGDVIESITEIINKYAGKGAGRGKRMMLNCALELKKAGFEGNARW